MVSAGVVFNLYNHPAALEATVVAAPEKHWGKIPCVFITLKSGNDDLSEDEIIAHCRANLAGFKILKKVIFSPELPKTSTGKLQKHVLRAQLAG